MLEMSIKKLQGLKQQICVTIPSDVIEQKFDQELNSMKTRVKIKGFRAKKNVPLKVIKERFGESVWHNVVVEQLMPDYLNKAFNQENLDFVGQPSVDFGPIIQGQSVRFMATFETFPKIEIKNPKKIQIQKLTAKVTSEVIDKSIDRLRRQYANWVPVDRKAQLGDQLKIDYEGLIKGVPFQGSTAKDALVDLEEEPIFPGFREGLIGSKVGSSFELKIKFPKDYGLSELAGKKAIFSVTVHSISEPELPELNAAFIKDTLKIEQGTLGVLREAVRAELNEKLTERIQILMEASLLDQLMAQHNFLLPEVLLNSEMDYLKNQMSQFNQSASSELNKDRIIEVARKRVSRLLLIRALIEFYNIKLSKQRMADKIALMTPPKHSVDDTVKWLDKHEQYKGQLEAAVLEEQVIEKLLGEVQINEKVVDFWSIMTG